MPVFICSSVKAIASLAHQGFVYIFNTGFACFGITLTIQQLFATNANHLLKYWFELVSSKSIITANLSTVISYEPQLSSTPYI